MNETVEVKSNGVSLTVPLTKWYALIREHSQVNAIKTAIGVQNNKAHVGLRAKRTIWTSQMVETLKTGLNMNKMGSEIAKEMGLRAEQVYNKIQSLKNSNSV